MPSLESYHSGLDYSYAPGIFPSMECLLYRPESVRRLLVHSAAAGREGIGKLTELAEAHRIRIEEADRALGRISGKENCFAAAVFGKFRDELREDRPHVVLHRHGIRGAGQVRPDGVHARARRERGDSAALRARHARLEGARR